MLLPPLSRRQFLRRLAFAAGVSWTGALASACGQLFPPSIDAAYLGLDLRHRASNLISGQIPASWKTLTPDQLMPRLQSEIANVVLPAVTRIIGGNPQEIASRVEYLADEAQVTALIQEYGESNASLATQMAKQGIGLTVSKFSETNTVPDKRIAVNITKILDLGKAQLSSDVNTDHQAAQVKLNAFVVQAVVDAVIHEATHYIMEVDRLPQPGDLERVQAMYKDGAIGTVEVQTLLYYEGTQLAFISRGGYRYYLNKTLTEILRAYVMDRVITEIESGIFDPPVRFQDSVYFLDTATNQMMNFIHTQLGIKQPAPPTSTFKNDLLRIIDYYQDPLTVASQTTDKKVRLSDADFVLLFDLFEGFYASIAEAIDAAGGKDLLTSEIKYRARLELGKIIDQAKERS